MTGLDVYSVYEEILAKIESAMPGQVVYPGGIDDAETILNTNGWDKPLIIVSFSDLLPSSKDKSFCGPRNDGYYFITRTMSIAPDLMMSLKVASRLQNQILGFKPENAGALSKEFGGGAIPIPASNARPVQYGAWANFRCLTNMESSG